MKICLIYSAEDGVNSLCNKYVDIPDPMRFIPESSHQFVKRYVTKIHAKRDIDIICKEGKQAGWEMYMNLMWGISHDHVAGIEATKYLESKGVTILTNPSKFLKKSKIDLYNIASSIGISVPVDTKRIYPKFVKYGNAYGSLNLDQNSVCTSAEAVIHQVAFMRKSCRQFKVLVQDYIAGREFSVVIIEVGGKPYASTPVECIFPENLQPNEAFLTWEMKFDERDNESKLKYALMEEEPSQSKLKAAAIKTFRGLRLAGISGWARINMRLESSTGKVFVIENNSIPNIFYPTEIPPSDDLAIRDAFPGGHLAFFDMLLTTKQIQMRSLVTRNRLIAATYDASADDYQAWIGYSDANYFEIMSFFIYKYDFSGSVLDVACGTGHFGKLLHNHGVTAEISGLDISRKMLQSKAIKDHYEKPTLIGPMQELIMVIDKYDHIVCFGGLHLLDQEQFNAVLTQMFLLALKSVTFEVDDLNHHHIQNFRSSKGDVCFCSNNIEASKLFGTPRGWDKISDTKYPMYISVVTGQEISGIWYRFEKTQYA